MATKLIFGLRAPQATQLIITNEKMETLSISLTSQSAGTISERCDLGSWTKDLEKSDYLVRVEGESEGGIRFTVTPKAGIVSYKPDSPAITGGWALDGTGDPKNPWPPPGDGVLALDDAQWLTEEVQKARASLTITREGPPWPSPLPSRTGRDRSEH